MKISLTKLIIGGVILIGIITLLAWIAWDKSAPGALIAGIAGLWGAFKANLFGKSAEEIKEEHKVKRAGWAEQKNEFNRQIDQLKNQMADLDFQSKQIDKKLKRLDKLEAARLSSIKNMSSQEKAKLLDTLL